MERTGQQDVYRDWLDLAAQSFETSTTWFDVNIRNEVEKNIRQFQSLHPKGSKYYSDSYKNRSKLFRPKTRASVRKGEATCAGAYFSSEDVIVTRAVNDDDILNKAGAAFYKELLQIRLTRPFPIGIPWFLTVVGAFQETETIGVVVSKQEWQVDEDKGLDRPTIKLRPVENVRIDPASDWTDPVNSSPYLIDMVPMYIADIKKRMSASTEESKRWFPLSDAEIKSAVKNSWDTTRQTRENRTDSKETNHEVTDYSIGWVHENIISKDGKDYVYFTLGTQFMLSEPRLLKEEYPIGIRPFTMGICIIEAHRIYPTSKVGLERDVQKELNEIINERRDNVKRILDPRWKALRGKQVDTRSLTRNVPASVTLLNSLTDAEMIKTEDVTGSSFQEQDRVNGDFDEIAGNFSSSSVANNRRLNETVGGLNLLSSDADIVGEYELRVFSETWVEPTLRQVLMLERAYETDIVIMQMAAEAAGIDRKDITEELLDQLLQQEVLLNADVGIGSTNPQKQLDRFVAVTKTAKELLGSEVEGRLNTEEVIKELFGKAGYRDGIRFFKLEQQEPDPMAELQRLVVQAKLELTQAQTKKALEDAEQSKAAKVVKMVEALYSAMQTAQTAVSVPGVAPAADAIAKSAGYVDQDQAPIYPQGSEPGAGTLPAIRENTSPMFPPQPIGPGEGMMRGIETQENDGAEL